jgi:hypothetical protein
VIVVLGGDGTLLADGDAHRPLRARHSDSRCERREPRFSHGNPHRRTPALARERPRRHSNTGTNEPCSRPSRTGRITRSTRASG